MNNEEDNADGIAFANAADFQDKVYETHLTIFSLKMRQNSFFFPKTLFMMSHQVSCFY
jgi:hypothetical protein